MILSSRAAVARDFVLAVAEPKRWQQRLCLIKKLLWQRPQERQPKNDGLEPRRLLRDVQDQSEALQTCPCK